MTEQELRTLVRQAVARHAGTHSPTHVGQLLSDPLAAHLSPSSVSAVGRVLSDPAHAMFVVPSGADADGPCLIEPAVMCNHCGYCKSMGH
jgi:hypothetical protein